MSYGGKPNTSVSRLEAGKIGDFGVVAGLVPRGWITHKPADNHGCMTRPLGQGRLNGLRLH